MRIVSLIASATEIVCALGLRDALVGRSHECDTPDDVTALPALTAPKFDTSVASRDIDRAVKDLVRGGLSVYRVDEAALRDLAPDLIVTQDQCEVCAASLKDVENAVCDWVGRQVEIVSLHPNCLADIWRDIARVGAATGTDTQARRLVADLQARIAGLGRDVARPRVLCVEWIEPLMTAGHWIPELVAAAGGEPLLADAGGPSPYVTHGQIAASDPDVIIVAPCGFDLARTMVEMGALDGDVAWNALRAVREGRVFVVDGNRYFNRPSPAVADTAEILREILDACVGVTRRRYGDDAWRRYVTAPAAPPESRPHAARSSP